MTGIRTALTLAVAIAAAVFSSALFAAEAERPARMDAALVTLQAKVAAVNHETREVTLENPDGKQVVIQAGEDVKNLDQVDVGDTVTVEYLEVVSMEVLPKGEVDVAAMTTAETKVGPLDQKPAKAMMTETSVITVIDAIDKENRLVTLKGPEGETKTVRARNPANLEKIAIGDKVLVTYTTALAVTVTEK